MKTVCVIDELTVNDVIRLFPETMSVFNDYNIDACCGGAVSIHEAASRDGADAGALREQLCLIACEES